MMYSLYSILNSVNQSISRRYRYCWYSIFNAKSANAVRVQNMRQNKFFSYKNYCVKYIAVKTNTPIFRI